MVFLLYNVWYYVVVDLYFKATLHNFFKYGLFEIHAWCLQFGYNILSIIHLHHSLKRPVLTILIYRGLSDLRLSDRR